MHSTSSCGRNYHHSPKAYALCMLCSLSSKAAGDIDMHWRCTVQQRFACRIIIILPDVITCIPDPRCEGRGQRFVCITSQARHTFRAHVSRAHRVSDLHSRMSGSRVLQVHGFAFHEIFAITSLYEDGCHPCSFALQNLMLVQLPSHCITLHAQLQSSSHTHCTVRQFSKTFRMMHQAITNNITCPHSPCTRDPGCTLLRHRQNYNYNNYSRPIAMT